MAVLPALMLLVFATGAPQVLKTPQKTLVSSIFFMCLPDKVTHLQSICSRRVIVKSQSEMTDSHNCLPGCGAACICSTHATQLCLRSAVAGIAGPGQAALLLAVRAAHLLIVSTGACVWRLRRECGSKRTRAGAGKPRPPPGCCPC
jgi:hypothetical protein